MFLDAHVWRAVTCAVQCSQWERCWMRGLGSLLGSVSWHKSPCGNSHLCVHAFRAKPTKTSTGSLGIRVEAWQALWTAGDSCRLSPMLQWTSKHVFLTCLDTSRTVNVATLSPNSARVINLSAVSGCECDTISIDTQTNIEWGIDPSLNQTATKH